MAQPTSKAELKDYVLRSLGHPMLEINVTNAQIDDRIDEAVAFFEDYHPEAAERQFWIHQIDSTDKTNKYLTLPDSVIGVYTILGFARVNSLSPLFNVQYQVTSAEMFALSGGNGLPSLIPYYLAMRHLEFVDQWLDPQPHFEFNRFTNKLSLFRDWNRISEGNYICAEIRASVRETEEFWAHYWLVEYVKQRVKRQWGENLSKFVGIQMPGGISFNGDKIYAEADQRIQEMERDLKSNMTDISPIVIG
jgi:hypothetical protein